MVWQNWLTQIVNQVMDTYFIHTEAKVFRLTLAAQLQYKPATRLVTVTPAFLLTINLAYFTFSLAFPSNKQNLH